MVSRRKTPETPPPRDESARRNWIIASFIGMLAVIIVLAFAQIDTRNKVTRVIESSPCVALAALPKDAVAAEENSLTHQCRDDLNSFGRGAVFSEKLACYIARRAGLAAPACGRLSNDGPQINEPRKHQRGTGPGAQSARSGSPSPAQPSTPSSPPPPGPPPSNPPSTTPPGNDPPANPPSNPPRPPRPPRPPPPDVSICVRNPVLPACVKTDLPIRPDL